MREAFWAVITAAALTFEPLTAYAQTAETPILEQLEEHTEKAARMIFTVDNVQYSEQNDGTLAVTGFSGSPKDIIIPSNLDGQRVTRINANAFQSCESLERIFLPESIEYIETTMRGSSYEQGMPFSGCENLAQINVESTNVNYCSENNILFNKDKTELIAYPAAIRQTKYDIPKSVKSICNHAFANCKYLTSVTIPDGVEVITDFAFYNCDALKSIVIPDSVKKIGYDAFWGCDNLVSAVIPYGVVEIGSYAFSNCENLLSITIPESVTSLGQGAFYNCFCIKDIKILANINYIDSNTFRFCPNIESLVLTKTLTRVNSDAFDGSTSKLKNVYFTGTKTQWAKLNMYVGSATVHCNYILPLEPVTGFKGTSTSNSVTLKWAKNPTADSYKIKQFVNGQYKTLVKTDDNSTTSYTVTGLSPNTEYFFEIYAFQGEEFSTHTTLSIKTTVAKPTPVNGLKAESGSNYIVLKWDKNPTADSYKIKQFVNGTYKELMKTEDNSSTQFTVTALSPNKEYTFAIYAFCGSLYSDPKMLTVKTALESVVPVAVTGLKSVANTDSVTLMWNSSSDADSYKIKQFSDGAWKEIVKTADNTTTSYTISGLKAGTEYKYAVYAFNGSKFSSAAIVSVRTASVAVTPAAVTGFIGRATNNSVTLSWNKSSDADSYKIKQFADGVWTELVKTSDNKTTSYTVTGLTAGESYKFAIYAFNGTRFSGANIINVTATETAAPSAVTGFKGTAATNSITLGWTRNTNADSYKIKQLVNGAWKDVVKTMDNTTISYTVSGLSANTEYKFAIYAFNGTQFSDAVIVTVKTNPSAVTGFTGAVSKNAVKLSWNKNSTADSYKIKQLVNGTWKEITKTANNSTVTYTVNGLTANTEYQFAIYAFNGTQFSGATTLTIRTAN